MGSFVYIEEGGRARGLSLRPPLLSRATCGRATPSGGSIMRHVETLGVQERAAEKEAAGEERCLCGNLLARLTPRGIEILCRRCRRKHLVEWEDGPPDSQPGATTGGG